jgi:uncharacterized membrane protein
MKRYLIAYAVMLVMFPLLDFAWFAVVARGLYQHEIGQLLIDGFKPAPAVIFYALYAAGVLAFVVAPALERRRGWARAAALAAFFGLVAFSAYDLTNLATLKGFTLKVGLVDMAWGAVTTTVAASLGRAAALRFA